MFQCVRPGSSCGALCCGAKKKKKEKERKPLLGATVEEINCTHSCHLRFKCFCNTAQLNRYLKRGNERPGPMLGAVGGSAHTDRERGRGRSVQYIFCFQRINGRNTKIWVTMLLAGNIILNTHILYLIFNMILVRSKCVIILYYSNYWYLELNKAFIIMMIIIIFNNNIIIIIIKKKRILI